MSQITSTPESKLLKVFISYSTSDRFCAEAICAALELRAIGCWIAPRNIALGQEWVSAITDAIRLARVMVWVYSSSANNSPHIMREVALAVDSGVAIIPFRIEHIAYSRALAYYLGTSQWIDALTEPVQKHINELTKVVAFLASHVLHSNEPPSRSKNSKATTRPGSISGPPMLTSPYFIFKSWEARAVRLGLMTGLLIGRNGRVEFSDRLLEILADFSQRWCYDFVSVKSEGELIGHAAAKVWSEIQQQRSKAILTLDVTSYLFNSVSQQVLNWLIEQAINAKVMFIDEAHVVLAQDLTDEAIDWIASHCIGNFRSELKLRSWIRNVFVDLVHARLILFGSKLNGTESLLGEMAFSMFRKSNAYRDLIPLAVKT